MLFEDTSFALVIGVSIGMCFCLDESAPLASFVLWHEHNIIRDILQTV